MTATKTLTSLLIIFLFSILGFGTWLYEIVEIQTWFSLDWLSDQLYSPFIATLTIVLSYLTPFFISGTLTIKKTITSIPILYTINIVCYHIGKEICYAAYSRYAFVYSATETVLHFLIPFLLYIFLGIFYWMMTNLFIKRSKRINSVLITALLISAIPMSLLTIYIYPSLGYKTDWVDTVKMGYPIFWTSLLLGIAGLLIARQPKVK